MPVLDLSADVRLLRSIPLGELQFGGRAPRPDGLQCSGSDSEAKTWRWESSATTTMHVWHLIKDRSSKSDSRNSLNMNVLPAAFRQEEVCSGLFDQVAVCGASLSHHGTYRLSFGAIAGL